MHGGPSLPKTHLGNLSGHWKSTGSWGYISQFLPWIQFTSMIRFKTAADHIWYKPHLFGWRPDQFPYWEKKNSRFFPFSMAPRNTGHEFHIYRLPEEEKELGKKKNVACPYLTSWWVKDKFTKLGNLKLSLTHWHTGETGDSGNSCETGCFV